MSTAVAKKEETTAVAEVSKPVSLTPRVDASDIIIPTLALQQSISPMCQKGKAKPGDIVRTTDKKIVATGDKAVEIIPLTFFKSWVIKKKKNPNDSRGEWVRTDPYKSGDEKLLPLNWVEAGNHYFRDLYFNLYCLRTDDIKAEAKALEKFEKTGDLPDPDTTCMPSLIRFKRSSYNAAKVIASHFAQCQDISERFGKTVAAHGYVFEIGREFIEKDNSYHVLTSCRSRKINEEERPVAERWLNTLSTTNVKVDDSDIMEESHTEYFEPENTSTREF